MTTQQRFTWDHYRAIANAIRDARELIDPEETQDADYIAGADAALGAVTLKLCEVLKRDNPRFDARRFSRVALD